MSSKNMQKNIFSKQQDDKAKILKQKEIVKKNM